MNGNAFDSLIQKIFSVDIDRRRHWYVLRAFSVFRLALLIVLLGLYAFVKDQGIGQTYPSIFLGAALAYFCFIVLGLIGAWRRLPVYSVQATLQTAVDVVVLAMMGLSSAQGDWIFPVLMIVVVAAGAVMLPLLRSLLLAAVAWVATIGYQLCLGWQAALIGPATVATFARHAATHFDLTKFSIIGAGLFGAGLVSSWLAGRIRDDESVAGQELQELLELAQLNQLIVQHLQSGIVVVDRFARIRLMNDTARQLLAFTAPAEGMPLNEVSPLLSQRLAAWLSISANNPRPFRQQEHLPDVTPTFSHLSANAAGSDTLILLEDSAQAAQRLQQIKLIALGRLTSSIAHEVRNPLASISHAAQLLQESQTASSSDKRFGQIIHDNAKRAGSIISHVLDLSRRDKAKPEEFLLRPWLEGFRNEFLRGNDEPAIEIAIRVQPDDLVVRFDTSHLQQVLWSLLTNACVHGKNEGESPRIKIDARLDLVPGLSRPILDVLDSGPGIPELESQRIFEPFFTTQTQGTGLGLYISREICEANRGQLQYVRGDSGSCFRIMFPSISKHEKQALSSLRRTATHQPMAAGQATRHR